MTWTVSIENVAGIYEARAELEPGANAVRATNWQGKSSFLAAVEAAMGTALPLREGAASGRVELDTDDRRVVVDLVREDGEVVRRGEPYLDDEQARVVADLFAFFDEHNEVRRAVRAGENLEAVLTRPLDFENIEERIADLRAERDRVDAELDRATDAAERLPAAEERVASLEADLEELRAERADLAAEASPAAGGEREELSAALAERETVENRVERLEGTVERTREKLEERRADLDSLTVPEQDADLAADLDAAREAHERARRDAELLQSVYAPTRRLVEEDRLHLVTDVERDVLGDDLTCWTCGAETTRAAVEAHLERLDERVADLRERAREHEAEVDRLESRLEERRAAERRRRDLRDEVGDLESTLADREASLESARERLADVDERIEELSAELEAADDRLTDVESDIKYTTAQLEDATEERDRLATAAERRADLRAERESLREEIERLRTRKETVERRTREAFDEAMADVLDRFDAGFETARLTADYELVVARDGREVPLDALSEGEVELLAMVTGLAGYEAFDVASRVPVMLVDDLGGLTVENVRTLVSYLSERTEYLVFTTYPELGSFEGHVVDPGEWDVVSRREA
ncbi:MAG: archaea-specific SMC-related protein [Haloarculaceae archaeon]